MESITANFYDPWPWFIVGPLMGAVIPLLLFWGNKMLGASSSLRHLCSIVPNQIDYFQYDLKTGYWNLLFACGVMIGAAITYHFFHHADAVDISTSTKEDLLELGLTDLTGLMPAEIFTGAELWSMRGLIFTLIGGFLVGFGVRYAGGCTSGHGFMGLSQMSLASGIAIFSFFIGGMIATYFILPLILQT
jgi:uncharacterized membrane protein YedE/YeeE